MKPVSGRNGIQAQPSDSSTHARVINHGGEYLCDYDSWFLFTVHLFHFKQYFLPQFLELPYFQTPYLLIKYLL